jgi:LPXTG-motif cell wall-anchored protein
MCNSKTQGEEEKNMKNDKARRRLIGFGSQMTVLAILAVTASAQTSTTTRTAGAGTTTTRQERAKVVYVEGNTVVLQMSSGAIREVTVPDSRTALIDGQETNVHGLKPGTTLNATYTTTTTPVLDRTVSNLSGTVWFVSGNTVILTLPDGTNKVYKSQPGYKFNVNGRDADVSALRKGMKIVAEKIVEEPSVIVANDTAITGSAPKRPVVLAQAKAPTAVPAATDAPAQLAAAPAPASAQTAAPASESAAAAPARLPKTGSMLPLAGMLGLLFTGAGFGLRRFRRL